MKTVFKNVMQAVVIMIYFIVLSFAYTKMNLDRLSADIEIFAGIFLVLAIMTLEKAYRKESGEQIITAIELFILSIHSLSITHITARYQYNFRLYLLTSSYIIAIYYVLKAIIIYTIEKRKYLKSFSDIAEIVKEEKPVKKEAKKRKNNKKKEEK